MERDFRSRGSGEQEEIEILRDIDKTEHAILQQLKSQAPKLTFIKIAFSRGENIMAEGPVTLTVGQKTVASIDGFDQNGAIFAGPIPTPSWAIDNITMDSIAPDPTTPANEDITSLAAGVANLTATVTSAEGRVLTDTETVTNVAAAPVLSSIKINFTTPV
jgi:hypothetical protein